MKERLAKLIDVKSLITISLTIIFCVQVLRGYMSEEYFKNIFSIVVAFYFGTQYQKKSDSIKST